MAENKKSFVLYADLIKSIEHLTNEEKGVLFNHLLEYVNDKKPVLEDRLILTAWKPIELQLKRDLVKFEEVKAKRSEAGKRSAELRALKVDEQTSTNPTSVESDEQTSTNPTDNDSVNDNDNDNDNVNDINNNKALPFSFYNSMIKYGFDKNLVSEWLKVRKTKKATNSETAFNSFIKEVEKTNANINDVLTECIVKSWSGFKSEWYKKDSFLNSTEKKKYEVSNAFGKEVVFLTDLEFTEKSKQNFNTYKLLN